MRTSLLTRPVGTDGPPDPVLDPHSAYAYLDAKRDVLDEEARARPLIRLHDKDHNYIGTVAGEKSLDAEEMLHDTGAAEIPIRADDWLMEFLRTDVRREEDLHITIDPYPHWRNWRWRWGGKVTNVQVKKNEDGTHTALFQCSHNREHWKHLLLGATPFMPPEVQPLKAWLMLANTRTAVATTGSINLARNYSPMLALTSNILNPGAWVGEASNLANLSPLNWPVQMQFVNPIVDQSRLTVLMSRWNYAHDVCDALLKNAGCHVRAYTWLPEDEDSPHPELAAIVGEKLARPSRACVVLAVEDKSGVTGPTGTAFDGVLNLLAVSADNAVGTVLHNVDADGDGEMDPWIRSLLKVAPAVPNVRFRDGELSPIISSEHSTFRAKALSIMTGGKSPGWVNQVQTFLIKYAIAQLSNMISYGPAAAENPGTPGLEEVYQGQFDDMLLAYIRFTDPVRAFNSGPYAYLEHFEQGSGSAYTVSSVLTLEQGHFKTRPYPAFKVAIRNSSANMLFRDFDLGDRTLFEIDGILYTDQVSAWKISYDETNPKRFDISIGDDRETESPLAQLTHSVSNLWNGVGMLFGSGDLF